MNWLVENKVMFYFYVDFYIDIKNWWEISLADIKIVIISLAKKISHGTIAVLPWHMQNCVAIELPRMIFQ